jgi:hypothetical protein
MSDQQFEFDVPAVLNLARDYHQRSGQPGKSFAGNFMADTGSMMMNQALSGQKVDVAADAKDGAVEALGSAAFAGLVLGWNGRRHGGLQRGFRSRGGSAEPASCCSSGQESPGSGTGSPSMLRAGPQAPRRQETP